MLAVVSEAGAVWREARGRVAGAFASAFFFGVSVSRPVPSALPRVACLGLVKDFCVCRCVARVLCVSDFAMRRLCCVLRRLPEQSPRSHPFRV